MRVIAGEARGHRLLGPPRGAPARPTGDRVRESLFAILGARVTGARVLDLFAGTGALGIEALSRGAVGAVLVEADAGMADVVRRNLEHTRMSSRARVLLRDVRRAEKTVRELGPFDLVLADPPWRQGLETAALDLACAVLAQDGTLVLEHAPDTETPDAWPAHGSREGASRLVRVDARTYGDTALSVYAREIVTNPEAEPPTER